MKKTIVASLTVVVLLALAVVCAGCTTTNNTTTQSTTSTAGVGAGLGNATDITVVQGQNFTIQLQSNPSTGYTWQPAYNSSAITLVNQTYFASSLPLAGAPGADVFTFQGTQTGTSIITFNNVSPANQTTNSMNYTITCTDLNVVPTGNAVVASQGENFTIRLLSNPSTGYHWEVDIYNNATLALVNQTYVSNVSASSSVVGAGGTDLFTFQGTQAGSNIIVFSDVSPANQTVSSVPYSVVITS